MNKIITLNNVSYEVIENIKDALDIEILKEKLTDYFDDYDNTALFVIDGKIILLPFYLIN